MSKYFLSVFLVTVIVALASCGRRKKPVAKESGPVVVDVIVANPRTISNIVEANGTVVANEFVELHPETSGRITYLNVPEGALVQKGTVIARINDADLVAQQEKAKVQLDLAIKTEERLRKLLAINGINQADYDAALNQLQSLRSDVAYYQALIDKTVVKAPFTGVVGLRQVSIGAYVSPANVIASLQTTNTLKIDFTIPEQYNYLVKKGNKVQVAMDATSGKLIDATIIAVEPQANAATRNLVVRVMLPNVTAHPGGFAKVYVDAGSHNKAILVPTNALIPEDKSNQVIVVKNGRASFVNVETGVRQASSVEITSGVNSGDTVVVTGVLFARPNGILKVREIKQPEN